MTRLEVLAEARALRSAKSDRQRVYACVETEPWATSREIAEDLDLPLATVSSHLGALWRAGRLTRSGAPRAYAYRVAA